VASKASDSTIVRWIRTGPDETDGTIGWMVGHMLWWRFWATMLLAVTPLAVGLATLAHAGGTVAVFATVGAHVLLHETLLRVNPKYDVTKNY